MTLPFTPKPPKTKTIASGGVRVVVPASWDLEAEAARLTALVAMDVTLTKGDREPRRYVIAGADRPGRHACAVWHGRNRHRQRTVAGALDATRAREEFDREIRDLVADGWAVTP